MDRFNEIKLSERVFNDSDAGLKLPRSARSYIDRCAHEYNDTTLEVKMYHFAFLLKRGFDVCKELRKDIDYHMENPQYGGYEDTAKYTLIDMLQKLITTTSIIINCLKCTKKRSRTKRLIFKTKHPYRDGVAECVFDAVFYEVCSITYLKVASQFAVIMLKMCKYFSKLH